MGVAIAVSHRADVMHVKHVDAGRPEPLQTVLVGAHDAAVAVIEDGPKRRRLGPIVVSALHARIGTHEAAYLRAQHEVIPAMNGERLPHASFGQRIAVVRRSVEVAQPLGPGGIDERLRIAP